MSASGIAAQAKLLQSRIQRTAEEILDRLPVTDRVYHHLDYSKPLVVELATRVWAAAAAPARVLVVGSDSLLAQLLIRLGYQVDLWHFQVGHLTDDLLPYVRQTVTVEQLAAGELPLPAEGYDAIVVPLVLESLPGGPQAFLGALRGGLRPSGSLIVATTNVSRLDLRLLALAGRNLAPAYPSFHVSLSFPPLPRLRYYHRDELLATSKNAGFAVRECSYIIANAACSTIDPHPPGEYLALQAGHGLMRLVPSTRHAIVLHLTRRVGDEPAVAQDDQDYPRVSVVLGVQLGGDALRSALTALVEQDYPSDRFEIIVLHDGKSAETRAIIREVANGTMVPVRELICTSSAEGPAARNAAMTAAEGDICAHTDDACRIPPGWVRTIAFAFDQATGALTGPVIEIPGSHPDFMVLPGTRLGWDPHETYPIFNVAYRRGPALAAGGFDAVANERDPLPFAWDAELAWRLQREGWKACFTKDMFLYRRYLPPKPLTWVKQQWQLAQDLPRAVARVPELQDRLLAARRFAGTRTMLFDLLVVGLLATVWWRRPKYLLLTLPWVGYYSRFIDAWPVTQWPSSARRIGAIGARHLLWFVGLVYGSVRARRVVL